MHAQIRWTTNRGPITLSKSTSHNRRCPRHIQPPAELDNCWNAHVSTTCCCIGAARRCDVMAPERRQ